MVPQLRALAIIAEDLNFVSGTYMVAHNPSSKAPDILHSHTSRPHRFIVERLVLFALAKPLERVGRYVTCGGRLFRLEV